MNRMRAWRYGAALALLAAGCASAPAGTGQGSRNLLLQDQLVATRSDNLYDAIHKLRPEWLTSRGPTSMTDASPTVPSIYLDGQAMGSPEYLRQLQAMDVTQVRYWEAGQAAARFGMGHPRGVIEISRR